MGRFAHSFLAAASMSALAVVAAPALANQMLYVDNVQVPLSESTTITGTVDGMAVSDSAITGQIVLTVNPGSTSDTSTEYNLAVWCIDLFHNIVLGSSGEQFLEEPLSTSSTDNSTAQNPTDLTQTQVNEISDLVAYGNSLLSQSSTRTALNSALVQSAIWTVEYNNPDGNYGPNTLMVTGAGIDQTSIGNVIMAAEADGGTAGQLAGLNGVQGQVYETPAPLVGNGLPSVLAIGGILLGVSLVGCTRKRGWLATAIPSPAGSVVSA